MTENQDKKDDLYENAPPRYTVWFLVANPHDVDAYLRYAERLEKQGHKLRVVNAPEVFGILTKEAIVGHAERFVHTIKTAIGLTEEEFQAAVEQEAPNVLFVCGDTFFRPLVILNRIGLSSISIVPVLGSPEPTDAPSPKYRRGANVQGWVVPMEETKKRFLAQAIEADRVVIGGFPLKDVGINEQEREDLRKRFKFDGQKVMIVRPGALQEVGDLEGLMFQLSLVSDDLRIIFHHDDVPGLGNKVSKYAQKKGMYAQMFGRVPNLGEYIAASDLVLTSADDDVSRLAVSKRTPVLLLRGESAGEVRGENSAPSVLGSAGAATDIFGPRDLPKVVLDALKRGRDEELLAAQELAIPTGTDEHLYHALESTIMKAAQWKARDATGQPGEPSYEDDGYDSDFQSKGTTMTHRDDVESIFETIGGARQASRDGEDPFEAMRRKFAETDGDKNNAASQAESSRPSHDSSRDRGSEGRPPGERRSEPIDPDERLYRGLDKRQAKAVMTELILEQRTLERELEDLEERQNVWYRRLNLARSQGAEDLEESAREKLRRINEDSDERRRQLALIERRKRIVKGSVGPRVTPGMGLGDGDLDEKSRIREMSLEDKFRQLEDDARLDDLKRSMEEK